MFDGVNSGSEFVQCARRVDGNLSRCKNWSVVNAFIGNEVHHHARYPSVPGERFVPRPLDGSDAR